MSENVEESKSKEIVDIELTEEQLDAILNELDETESIEDVEDVLFESRYIYINDVIDSNLANQIVSLVHYYNLTDKREGIDIPDRETIKVMLNTDGGCLHSSILIAQVLRASETPVKTVCNGKAYSGGLLIFMAVPDREVGEFSELMYHEARTGEYGISGTFVEVGRSMKNFDRLQKVYDKLVIEGSNITQKQLNKYKNNVSDWFIDRDEAIELGIIKG